MGKQLWSVTAGRQADTILGQQSWSVSRKVSRMLEFHEAGDPDVNHPGCFHLQLNILCMGEQSWPVTAEGWAEAILDKQLWGTVSGKASRSNPWLNVDLSFTKRVIRMSTPLLSLSTLNFIHGQTVMIRHSRRRAEQAILGQQTWSVSRKASQSNHQSNIGVSQSGWPKCQPGYYHFSRKVSWSNFGPAVARIHLLESKPKQSLIECWSFTKRVTQMSSALDTITFLSPYLIHGQTDVIHHSRSNLLARSTVKRLQKWMSRLKSKWRGPTILSQGTFSRMCEFVFQ